MRVIGGEFRGRRLRAPAGTATRPTSDRVRESLFDILAGRVEGACFLDGYAGTGAVGIEALSRGASSCAFVESDRTAARILGENLAGLRIESRACVLVQRFERAAARLGAGGDAFHIVFLDPPYGPGDLLRALRLVDARGLLRPHGLLIAEHDAGLLLPEREGRLGRVRVARYGGTSLTFFEAVDREGGGP